jgi:type IV secretion system protein TrbD
MSTLPEGFEQPLFRSLTEPILLAGAPRNLAILNATLSLSIALGLKLWLAGAILGLLGHGAAMLAARHDPQLLGVLVRHLRLPPHFAV